MFIRRIVTSVAILGVLGLVSATAVAMVPEEVVSGASTVSVVATAPQSTANATPDVVATPRVVSQQVELANVSAPLPTWGCAGWNGPIFNVNACGGWGGGLGWGVPGWGPPPPPPMWGPPPFIQPACCGCSC